MSIAIRQIISRSLGKPFNILCPKFHKPTVVNMSTITSHTVKVDGHDVHYEKTGYGDHVLLLFPGALGSSKTDFQPQLQGLNKEKFTILAWDPKGYGKSIPPDRDISLDFYYKDADDAIKFMENLGHSSYSLLGWSDGANSSTIMAFKVSSRIRKLVIWGGNSYVTPEEKELYQGFKNTSSWSERMLKPMVEMYGKEYFVKHWAEWCDIFQKMPVNDKGIIDLYTQRLRDIKSPTLIVHGDKDPMVPKFQPEYLHEHIKGSRLVCWPDGKHNIHLRFHERFNSLVEEFLLDSAKL